jgi:hypothetical protein
MVNQNPVATMAGASGLWRSEDMVLAQLHMQREAAHQSILNIGHLGKMQFLDLNKATSAFARDFSSEVRRGSVAQEDGDVKPKPARRGLASRGGPRPQ